MKTLQIFAIVVLAICGSALLMAQNADKPSAAVVEETYNALTRAAVEEIGPKDWGINKTRKLTAGLNKLAASGWELVEIEPGRAGDKLHSDAIYIFRRIKN
jgi:hypothetical protein